MQMTVQHTWEQIIQGHVYGNINSPWPGQKWLYAYQIYSVHAGLKSGYSFSKFSSVLHMIKFAFINKIL